MKKVLGRAALVFLISSSLHAGPQTPDDFAFMDEKPAIIHRKIKALLSKNCERFRDVVIGSPDLADHIRYGAALCEGWPDANAALYDVMGNWTKNPSEYGVLGCYIPSQVASPHNSSLYHRIMNGGGPKWQSFSSGAPTSIAQRGLFGSLDNAGLTWPSATDVSKKIRDILFTLGTNADFSNQVKSVSDLLKAIGSGWTDGSNTTHVGIIGDYKTGVTHTPNYTGILGALADTGRDTGVFPNTVNYGVKASLGTFTGATIKDMIESQSTPPTWNNVNPPTPDALTGILGTLGAFDGEAGAGNVRAQMAAMLSRLGTNADNMSTPKSAKLIADAIGGITGTAGVIGAYTHAAGSNFSGILGALADTGRDTGVFPNTVNYGVKASLGTFAGTTIKDMIESQSTPPTWNDVIPPTPNVLTGILGTLGAFDPAAGAGNVRAQMAAMLSRLGTNAVNTSTPASAKLIADAINAAIGTFPHTYTPPVNHTDYFSGILGDITDEDVINSTPWKGVFGMLGYGSSGSVKDRIAAAITDLVGGSAEWPPETWTLEQAIDNSDPTMYGCKEALGLEYNPSGSDSLFTMITRSVFGEGVFGDLGYPGAAGTDNKSVYKMLHGGTGITSSLFGDLGHKTDGAADSASTRAGDIRTALGYAGNIYNEITTGTVGNGLFGDLGYTGASVYAKINAVGVSNSLFGDLGFKTATTDSASTRAGDIRDALGNFTGGGTANIYNMIQDDATIPTVAGSIKGALGYAVASSVKDQISAAGVGASLFGDLGFKTATTDSASTRAGDIKTALGYTGNIYNEITTETVGNGLFGDLGSSGSASTRAGDIKTALGYTGNIYNEITTETVGNGLFGDLGHKTGGASDSASTRAGDIKTAIGTFTGGGTANIYNMISDTGKPNFTSSQYFGVRGTLNGAVSTTVFAAFEAIRAAIAAKDGDSVMINLWADGQSLVDWINGLS